MAQQKIGPSANNMVQGGRRVYIKRSGEANYVHIGFLEKADPTPQLDVREVENGYDGSKVLIKRRSSVKSIEWDIVTLERTKENLRFWYQGGSLSADTQVAGDVEAGDAKTIVDCLIGVAAYGDIVAGRYYAMSQCDGGKTRVRRLDPATPPTVNGLVEGTGFWVDYENGMIAFAATPGSALAVTLKWLALAGSTFSPWSVAGIDDCVAEIVTVGEEGKIVERTAIPKCRLEPAGSDVVNITDDSKLNLKLIQLKHATSGWGTVNVNDLG
jgi:hypothetical protein